MRVVVVGAGRMGALRAEDLAADPRVHEVVIANRSAARAEELAARLGATTLPWSQVGSADVDATVVALATGFHAEVLERVLPQGRPVLCEKPIALTLADTQRMIDLAARHGSAVQVGFQRRFDPGLHAVRRKIVDGGLGTLYAVRMLAHDHLPATPGFIATSGGIFRDLFVHDLDLAAWLTDSPVETVYATIAVREHPQYDVRHRTSGGEVADGDVALVHAVTASGVQVSLHGARHDPRGQDVRVEVFGSRDSVSAGLTERTPLLPLDDTRLLHGTDGSAPAPYRDFIDRFRDAFRAETAAFVDLVGGAPNPCPPRSAVDSLRAAIACEVSVDRGAPVPVSQILTADH